MNAEYTANHILIDVDTESQRDLLGDARTTPVGITPFHLDNGVDEFFLRSLGARSLVALRREQQAVFSFHKNLAKMQQRPRFQNDSGSEKTRWANEKRAQPVDESVPSAQVGRTLATSMQHQQLMPDQNRFGYYTTYSAWPP
jgi:hypothetical protein